MNPQRFPAEPRIKAELNRVLGEMGATEQHVTTHLHAEPTDPKGLVMGYV
jgi:hypothetical protein